jgi:two-component system sensor histidine kinase AlgZ
MSETPRPAPDASTPAGDDFFLPDFRNMAAVFKLLVVSQLLALFLLMTEITTLSPFPWVALGLKSLLLSWVAMSSAGLFCALRPQLMRVRRSYAAFIIFFLFLALVAFFTFLAEGVLLFLNIRQPGEVKLVLALARNLIMGGIIAGLVLRYFFLQEQLLRRQRTELTARLQALQARIRPHFLFNSMNIIASLISVDPDMAEEVVEDLSSLFRASLKAEGEVPLTDELELCKRYLNIEHIRLGNRLTLDWRVENLPPGLRIPALTLQPLLENAIYHGVEPASSPAKVTILVTWTGQEVTIVITNPYYPDRRSQHKGNRMALGNIKERLRAHYGEKAKLHSQATENLYTTYLSYPFALVPQVAKALQE